MSKTSLNFGHQGSKTRSLGQIKEIPSGHPRGYISCSTDLKTGQNDSPGKIPKDSEFGSPAERTISLYQIKIIPCGLSRGHISCSVDLKIAQNICPDTM